MKQISNRQKMIVTPRESAQKFLLKAKSVRKGLLRRQEALKKTKKSEKGRY